MWITLNEPNDEMVSYQEGHQMLRAHALAWRAYDCEFRDAQGGQVGRTAVLRLIGNVSEEFLYSLLYLSIYLLPCAPEDLTMF